MHHGFSAGGLTSAEELSAEQLLLNWRAYLRSGVTSVVSTGDDPQRMIAARAAERAGELVGPRIFAAGSVLTAPGGHPVGTLMHGHAIGVGELAVELDDPAAATEHVRTALEKQGLDLVKVIYSTIPGDGPRLRRDVLDAVVAEAHRCGRPIVAHVSTAAEAAEAVEAGVDGLEHMVLEGDDLLDAAFTTMAERGVLWTPTLSLFDRMAHDFEPPDRRTPGHGHAEPRHGHRQGFDKPSPHDPASSQDRARPVSVGDDPVARQEAVLSVIDTLQRQNVPLDALGIQAHLVAAYWDSFNPRQYRKFLRRVADRGLKILITEIDVLDDGLPAEIAPRDRGVADIYAEYLDPTPANPAVKSLITFGLSDRYTWLQADYPREDGAARRPLHYDEELQPKPALRALRRELASAPRRRALWRSRRR